jgi:hypothetical protein
VEDFGGGAEGAGMLIVTGRLTASPRRVFLAVSVGGECGIRFTGRSADGLSHCDTFDSSCTQHIRRVVRSIRAVHLQQALRLQPSEFGAY